MWATADGNRWQQGDCGVCCRRQRLCALLHILQQKVAMCLQDRTACYVLHFVPHVVVYAGTYNNQYIVVDLNKFHPGAELQPGLLTIVEQMPGLVMSADLTQVPPPRCSIPAADMTLS